MMIVILVIIFHLDGILMMEVLHIKMQAWQEELERARQGQREAENKLSSLEARIFLLFSCEVFLR